MRPTAFLASVLLALAASSAALASDFDFAPLEQELARELQERIDRTLLEELAARVSRQLERELALRAGRPVGSDSVAPPERMTCRPSAEHGLECVVVSKRTRPERVARVP
jgi:hypothetical protein